MDELVQSVAYYNPRPLLLHGYLGPFFVLQAVVYYYFSLSGSLPGDELATTGEGGQPQVAADAEKHSHEIWVIAVTISVAVQLIVYLFCHWSIDARCLLSCNRSRNPFNAKYAKVVPTPNNGSTELVHIRRDTGKGAGDKPTLWFRFQKTKYLYSEAAQRFVQVEFACNQTVGHYKQWRGYQEPSEVLAVDKMYGRNELDMVIPAFKELFIERATAPFFVFQTFCVGLWCLDEYWYYSLFTLFMLVTFEVVLVNNQMRNMAEIRRMGNQPYMIQVLRQNKWKTCKSDQLVVGDLVCVARSEHNIPCDILLIRGSCIVDESTLTGESVPQTKEPLADIDDDERRLNLDQDRLHILYGGTKVLQHSAASNKEPGCVGYVLKTGFSTSQGKLLRTILFGVKRVTANNFETFCFIMFLLFFAVISAWYVWTKGVQDATKSRYRLFFECAVIITSVVPPELPIELSLAVNTSLLSLSKLYIFCTEPFRIPFAGKVEYCCFDKTGTLTSDDLIVEGVAGLPNYPDANDDKSNSKVSSQEEEDSLVKKGALAKKDASQATLATNKHVTSIDQCPVYTLQVLASCHSLAHLDEKLVGDPLEKKVLEAINWNYSKSGTVTAKKARSPPLKIHQRFHFNSTLKRMSVVCSYKLDMSNENVYICTGKGAPEFMKPLMKEVPDNYDQVYLQMSRLGARVLALGFRTLGALSHQEVSELKREETERNFMFAGFLLISCPLKPDSREVSLELAQSGHRLVMITGDGALTACHVGSLLNFVTKEVLILTRRDEKCDSKHEWNWTSTDLETSIPFGDTVDNFSKFSRTYDLCLTGDALNYVMQNSKDKLIYEVVQRVKIFARVTPKQKEHVITTLKSRGKTVLMCGDGTNDVGALKHADVGVALLSSAPNPPPKQQKQVLPVPTMEAALGDDSGPMSANAKLTARLNAIKRKTMLNQPLTPEEKRQEKMLATQAKLRQLLEEQEQPQFVKLGDASIAAPFTSRLSSTRCISHVIKQGRCTLVTTMQMFKILALNALLSAYCHSVLYLDGIKFSDAQFTIQGLLSTLCFLFITRSQPLTKLSSQRPLPNIFNLYTILTVTLQFMVHFSSLIFLYTQAKMFQQSIDEKLCEAGSCPAIGTLAASNNSSSLTNSTATFNETVANNTTTSTTSDFHTEFKPSLINSTVYIIWLSVQIATFVVNHKGHPFMQDLRSNRPLCMSFIGSALLILISVTNSSPGLTEQLSIVEFPADFKNIVLATVVLDFALAYALDRICEFLFGRLKLKQL